MDYLKSTAISICAVTLLFGIVKNLLPSGKYEKYMRLTLTLIFTILIISGFRAVIFDHDLIIDSIDTKATDVTLEDQLCLQIKTYLNDQLQAQKYELRCLDVTIEGIDDHYYISKICVSTASTEAIDYLQEITGLQEEQIYVRS